tara:strand:+ start:280 stop:624 length:345 start_codon:yes stop_codon:yes gene_type:complete
MTTRKEMYSEYIKNNFPEVRYNSKQFKVLMSQHACMVKDITETLQGITEQEILDNFDTFYKTTNSTKSKKLKIVDTFSKVDEIYEMMTKLQNMNQDDEDYDKLRNKLHIMSTTE